MSKTEVPVNELLASIRPRDRVTILRPNGKGRDGIEWKEATGRCVIAPGRHQSHATLNMGGPHGTPGIADARNLVRVGQRIAVYDAEQGQYRCDEKQTCG
tara:strand:+ start:177273 stop:177572 length:300 start_codon:yes stop_codon:yes gene_type:complete